MKKFSRKLDFDEKDTNEKDLNKGDTSFYKEVIEKKNVKGELYYYCLRCAYLSNYCSICDLCGQSDEVITTKL